MQSRNTIALWVLALSALSASACSLILEAEDKQCSSNLDCEARGFSGATCSDGLCVLSSAAGGMGGDAGEPEAGGRDASPEVEPDADTMWGCVGNVSWPDPDITTPVTVKRRILKLIGEAPVEGLTLTACSPLDFECSQPIATGTTDANGDVEVPVYSGFDGYLMGDAPDSYPEMVPALMYVFPPPVVDDPIEIDEPLHVTASGEVDFMSQVLEMEVKPELGHILSLALDCQGRPAAGASLKIDIVSTDTVPYYMNGSLPSRVLTETGSEGEAGFINVPPGLITVTTTVSGVGKVSQLTVLVRAGYITYLPLAPSP